MSVEIAKRSDIDLREVVRRSPIAHLDGALRILEVYVERSSEVRYGIIDGYVACMWGLRPPTLISDNAYLWLLTTDIIAEHKFLFIRYSQLYIEEALRHYPTITGDVLCDNHPARRWLKWLGAVELPPDGKRIPFVIKAKHNG